PHADLTEAAVRVWDWLCAPGHRRLLALWTEAYARSLLDDAGPWGGFAAATVADWLSVLASFQPVAVRRGRTAAARRTAVLALLRGCLLDLLATEDVDRTTAAVHGQLRLRRR
ncbi:MAG: TetR/AcrR family transcriptional regulator, partial [Solirubrobacteraceae bacterium]